MQQKTLKTFEKYWSAEKSDGVNHVDRKPDAIFRKGGDPFGRASRMVPKPVSRGPSNSMTRDVCDRPFALERPWFAAEPRTVFLETDREPSAFL
jgi:hypothetical protein